MISMISGLKISLLAICLLSQISNSFHVADAGIFPDVMFASKAIADQTALAIDALRQASVPMTLDSAVSIAISEVFAGAAAGAITRRAADLLGDKKKDTFRTKVSTTGAFFGARGLARGLARAIGFPKPLALLIGSIAGSIVSEGTKIFGRTEAEQNERKLRKVTIFEDSGLKASEITGDIVKWLVYDGVENMVVVSHSNDFIQLVFATFVVGSISAVSGSLTKDFGSAIEKKIDDLKIEKEKEMNTVLSKTKKNGINSNAERKSMKTNTKLLSEEKIKSSKISTTFIQTDNNPYIRAVLFRYCTSAIEGGVLFASYQIVTKFVTMIIPENYNMKFVFNQVIEEIEREIDPDIV